MPHMGRAVLPDYLHHIIQRGDNWRLRASRFLGTAIPEGERHLVRDAVQRGQPSSTDRFVAQVETILGKRIENRYRGRLQQRKC